MSLTIYRNRTEAASTGRSVFLLGQSNDGPVNEPIPVNNLKDARAIFGEGNLLDAYEQVKDIPDIRVHLMRITGEYARLALLGETAGAVQSVLNFRSAAAGARYNGIEIYIGSVERDGTEHPALIVESTGFEAEARSYILADYQDLTDLARQVNRDAYLKRGLVSVTVANPDFALDALHLLNSDKNRMTGGADGDAVTRDDLYLALDDSYGILEGRPIDVLCPYPVRLDDIHPATRYGDAVYGEVRYGSGDYLALHEDGAPEYPLTFHEQLIAFCEAQERFGFMTHGVIGLRENPAGDAMSPHLVARLAGASAFSDRYGLTDYRNGNYIDRGHRISVFAQDIRYGGRVANGAAMYAGMVGGTEPHETTTNRVLPAGIELAFELSPEELRMLSAIGVVAARSSVRKGIVITNGVTAGLPTSPLHLIGNTRMIQYTLTALNRALDDMLGEPYVPNVTLREIERRCKETLVALFEQQVLRDYQFVVQLDSRVMRASVELSLQPRYSTESIKATSALEFAPSGGDST